MNRNKFRFFHHLTLAFTTLLYSSDTSIRLLNCWPSWQILFFLGISTLLAYTIANQRPIINFYPTKLKFQSTVNKPKFYFLLVAVVIALSLLTYKIIIVAFILGSLTSLYFVQWVINGKTISGIRSIPLIKNILLAIVWSATTVWFTSNSFEFSESIFYLFITRFVYVFAICLAVDLRDIAVDRDQNTTTLPILFGYKKIKILCYILLVLFLALILFKPESIKIPFQKYYHDYILCFSSILTIASLTLLKEKDSYFRQTILLDGNMFLQAFLLVI